MSYIWRQSSHLSWQLDLRLLLWKRRQVMPYLIRHENLSKVDVCSIQRKIQRRVYTRVIHIPCWSITSWMTLNIFSSWFISTESLLYVIIFLTWNQQLLIHRCLFKPKDYDRRWWALNIASVRTHFYQIFNGTTNKMYGVSSPFHTKVSFAKNLNL